MLCSQTPSVIRLRYTILLTHVSQLKILRKDKTRADPAPRGAYRGRAPPKWLLVPPKRKLFPPKRGLCPEEINRIGATGVQIEAQIGDVFMTFLGWRPFSFGDHLYSAGKTAWICDFGRKIPLNLCFSPRSVDPGWDKFFVPPCPSRIHTK